VGLVVSLFFVAIGLILALAVHPTNPGSVDVNTVGWILFVIGIVGFLLDLMLWSSWGPGYMRRTAVVDSGYPARARGPRRRTIVEDEVAEPPPGPPGPPP
jgi:Domain of unknown function (DUF6458)